MEKFKEFFKDYPGSYVIIGGTASDIIIDNAGLTPGATMGAGNVDVEALFEQLLKNFNLNS